MFVQPLIYFLLILLITSFIGFGISILLFRINLLRRIILSPLIGYSIITIAIAQSSYMGFGTNQSALPTFIGLSLISTLGIIIKRKEIRDNCNQPSNIKLLAPIILFGLANAAILMAPGIFNNAYSWFNDHTIYISFSEHFRNFGFFSPTHTGTTPFQISTSVWRSTHLHVGAQLFVSFFSALLQTEHTIAIYPSLLGIVALIFMSAIGSLYLSLRQEKSNIAEISFVLFFSLIAVNLGSLNLANGFLPHALGITIYAVLLGFAHETFYTNNRNFTLIGLLFASSILTYHETTLFYGAGIFIFLLFEYVYKKNKDKTLYLKFILSHIVPLVLFPIATSEFIMDLYGLSAQYGVGWHISYTALDYIQMLFGQNDKYLITENIITKLTTILGICAAFFSIHLLMRKRFLEKDGKLICFVLLTFSPFIVAVFLFAFTQFDPFTHEVGHTWRIFKAMGYSYWIIPVITGMATYWYFKENMRNKIITIIILTLLIPSTGKGIYLNYLDQIHGIELYSNNDKDPLNELELLAKNIRNNEQYYSPANLISNPNNPNYLFFILNILENTSTGDFFVFSKENQLHPSNANHFYAWINHLTEHSNTEKPITKIAGYNIYPQKSSSVYLSDGFSGKETNNTTHFAWLASNSGTIKAVVPQGEKAQFSTMISNWQEKAARVEIMYNGKSIFLSDIGSTSIKFESPVLPEGNHQFTVNYYGAPRVPDANEGRTLYLMCSDTTIKAIK